VKRFIISLNIQFEKGGNILSGRIRSIEGIKVFPETDFYHLYKPDEINYDSFIDPELKESIHILAHRPGLGKTYKILGFLKDKCNEDKDFSFFYFTDRHNTIKEHTKDWKEGTYSHWMGFDKICPRSRMKNLYKVHLWPKDICNFCGKCEGYTSQFKNNKWVFAPYNYLCSDEFKKNLPDIVIIDENPKQFTLYKNESEEAIELFKTMEYYQLVNLIKKKDWKQILDKYPYNKTYLTYKKYILEITKDKKKNKKKLQLAEKINLYDFYKYIFWDNLYKYNLKTYGIPTQYYDAFDAVTEGVPVVFLDATFNPNFFSYLLESYNGESKHIGKKGFQNLIVFGYREDISDIDIKSTIFRMKPEDSMPKSSFTDLKKWEHTRDNWLSTHMSLIMRIFGRNNVGIITYKNLGEFPKTVGYPVEYYGNLRGTNLLKDKPVLVIIGSYLPIPPSWIARKKGQYDSKKKYFEEILSEYFLLNVRKEHLLSVGVEAPKLISKKYDYSLAKIYSYIYLTENCKPLNSPGDLVEMNPSEMLVNLMWFDEIYQAFHRNRPLRYPRIIFAYCWFPEPKASIFLTDKKGYITHKRLAKLSLIDYNIREEFKEIKKVKNDDVNQLFDFLSETEYGKGGLIEEIVEYILQHPNVTSKELTERYKIFKTGEKRGADTIPMTDLIKTVKILKDKAKRLDLR
jgi:hypothetical protein